MTVTVCRTITRNSTCDRRLYRDILAPELSDGGQPARDLALPVHDLSLLPSACKAVIPMRTNLTFQIDVASVSASWTCKDITCSRSAISN